MTSLPVGHFIVIEGGDAGGKSTQVTRLVDRLRDSGRDAVATFEPGATEVGRVLRSVVLGENSGLDPRAEALIIAADRAQHTAEVVRPALSRGMDVVSDRYIPSSLAYQGRARELGVDVIRRISGWATDWLEPDLVVVLDVPPNIAAERSAGRVANGSGDRMESEGVAFHAAVRQAYLDLAERFDWVLVDGAGDADEVSERVWKAVTEHFGGSTI